MMASELSPSSIKDVRVIRGGWSASSRTRFGVLQAPAIARSSLVVQPWIESITQSVAHRVEPKRDQEDHHAGNGRDVRGNCQHLPALGEHRTPLRVRRLNAQTEEGEARGEHNRLAHFERAVHDYRRDAACVLEIAIRIRVSRSTDDLASLVPRNVMRMLPMFSSL